MTGPATSPPVTTTTTNTTNNTTTTTTNQNHYTYEGANITTNNVTTIRQARLMINGLEGIPGSGKSYEAVVYQVLHALKRGRLVITNLPLDLEAFAAIDPDWLHLIEIRTKPMPVRGTWDAERVPAFQLFAPGEQAPEPGPLLPPLD